MQNTLRSSEPDDADIAPRSWHVLIVEDNPIYQKMTAGMLQKQGHTVWVAHNGLEALAALERETFAIVLMDLEMPVMGGLEATSAFRAREGRTDRRLPILAVTSCNSDEDRARCFAAGMDGHLVKPVQAVTLLQAIQGLLERSQEKNNAADCEPCDKPFDYDTVLQRVDGDRDLLIEITQMFLEECPKLMQEIRTSILKKDAPQLRLASHTLRGSLANLSAASAQHPAHALETMGRTGNFTGAVDAFATLEIAMDRLQPALVRILEISPVNMESIP